MQIICMQKEFLKDFEIKKLGKYHDLYLKSDTLRLVNVFENFRKLCLGLHQLDSAISLSASLLA